MLCIILKVCKKSPDLFSVENRFMQDPYPSHPKTVTYFVNKIAWHKYVAHMVHISITNFNISGRILLKNRKKEKNNNYIVHVQSNLNEKNPYSFGGSSSIGPSISRYWLKAVSITSGLVHTAEKFSFSVIQAIPDGILSQIFTFSRQQTLSWPVGIATQFPQMHLYSV